MKIFTSTLPTAHFLNGLHLPKILPTRFAARLLMIVVLCLGVGKGWGQVSITSTGTAYTENFNTLALIGTSSTVPSGWAFLETGTNANAVYTAGTGSGTGGDTYSFGSASSSERAFGGQLSGTLTSTIGVAYSNNSGSTIGALIISYTGEQWRLGALGRVDRMDFQYSINATSLTTGTWTDVNDLDFTAPVTAGTVGALDGNAAANRTAIGFTITGLSIPDGATFWIRWSDFNATSSDDGLAIDDYSLTATAAVTPAVAISDGAIAASNVNQGALNVILQRYNLAVTSANATLDGLTVTTAGSYISSDISNLKVRYSADATLDVGDATLSTLTTGLGVGSLVFTPFTSQLINTGSTGYIFVTADIDPTATPGNTINVEPTTFTNISFSGTVTKTGTNPVAAGGAKTFVAVTPDVVLSSLSPAVPAATIYQNTNDNIIYRFNLTVTTANATLDGVTINTSGTNTDADVNNFKCWYSADDIFNVGSDILLSTKTTFNGAGMQVFPAFTNQVITNGSTGYIFITASLPCAATNGNTIIVDAITTADISFVSGNKTGTASSGDIQTIASATPVNVTGATANNLNMSSTISWTNPAPCFEEVLIVAATASNTGMPAGDGTAYTGDLTYGNGSALGNGFVVYKGSASPQTILGLTNGTTYYLKIFTRNNSIWSSGVEVMATPVTPVSAGEILINKFNPAYVGATDEYVEIVNTTNRSINLSNLQLRYQSASGTSTSSLGTLSGTIEPYSFWLLSTNATIDIGITTGISRDGNFNGGMNGTAGQIAIVDINTSGIVDAVGYGTITGSGTYTETLSTAAPTSNSGFRRNIDGFDSNNNNSDFASVTTANIYLRNSTSRLANTGAVILAGAYTDLSVTGNSSLAGVVNLTGRVSFGGNNNVLTTNGNLVLKSNASGTASVGDLTNNGASSGNAISGDVTVERWIPQRNASASGGRAYRLLTPTVSGGSINANWMEGGQVGTVGGSSNPVANYGTHITGSGGLGSGFDVTLNNQASLYTTTNGAGPDLPYTAAPNTTDLLDALTGYFLYIRGDRSSSLSEPYNPAGGMSTTSTTLKAKGTVQQGNITFTISTTADHFSMVTNPYPSVIDWQKVFDGNNANIANSYTMWDPNSGTEGGFIVVDYAGLPVPASTAGRYIQPGEAFLVKTTGGGGSITITEAMKVTGNNNNGIFRLTPFESFGAELYFTEATNNIRHSADGILVKYDNNYNAGIDGDDALELNNWNENIAINRSGKQLAVEARPVIVDKDTIPLIIGNLRQTNYEWVFTPSMFTNIGLKAELIDNFLNTRTLLSVIDSVVVPFNVTANPASSAANRFMVVFGAFGPLAIDVISIKAQAKNNSVQVDWTAKTEQDMDRYELERSFNGTSFSNIKTTAAMGNSPVAVNYTWLDVNPQVGNNYYRIKAIDKAGLVKYTSIVKVVFGKTNTAITVSPNPVTSNILNLKLSDLPKGSYTLQLFNSMGQQVLVSRFNHVGGSVNQPVNLPGDIAGGTYQLVLSDGETRSRTTIIKN